MVVRGQPAFRPQNIRGPQDSAPSTAGIGRRTTIDAANPPGTSTNLLPGIRPVQWITFNSNGWVGEARFDFCPLIYLCYQNSLIFLIKKKQNFYYIFNLHDFTLYVTTSYAYCTIVLME